MERPWERSDRETCCIQKFSPHTNAELQGNLLQDYEHKFEQLPEDQKLYKLCCHAYLKIVEKGHFIITLDEEEGPDERKKDRMNVHTPREHETVKEQGLTPIGTRWVFTNKCATERPVIRAGLVAQETKKTTKMGLTDTSMTDVRGDSAF